MPIVFYNFLAIVFLLCFLTSNGQEIPPKKGYVTAGDTLVEFYLSEKKPKPKRNFSYTSFNNFKIQTIQGGYLGGLLDGQYQMVVRDILQERGEFKLGIKSGVWTNWYENGIIQKQVNYSSGELSGEFVEYDEQGNHLISGKYKRGAYHGWIVKGKNRNVFRKYKKGVLTNDVKSQQPVKDFFSRLFPRGEKESSSKKGGSGRESNRRSKKQKQQSDA